MTTQLDNEQLHKAARRMPFDQFGRYAMLREAVDACRHALGTERLRVLDVGGFWATADGTPTLPVKEFLPLDEVLVVDVVACDLPGYIRGDGAALDWPDAAFDLVVSCDTLEHIPRPRREAFWRELLRVARHGVILLAPFGTPEVEAAEELVEAFIQAELRREQPQLREHREYGLPRLDDWLAWLEREGVAARSYPTGYLHAWLGMMLLKHLLPNVTEDPHTQQLPDIFYNQVFMPSERRNPAYRHLVVAAKTRPLIDAVDEALAPTIGPDDNDASAAWGHAMLPTLMAIVQRQLGRLHHDQAMQLERYQQQVAALQQALIDLNAERARQYEETIRDLDGRARWLEEQAAELRRQLEAVRNGRVMRVLNAVGRGKQR